MSSKKNSFPRVVPVAIRTCIVLLFCSMAIGCKPTSEPTQGSASFSVQGESSNSPELPECNQSAARAIGYQEVRFGKNQAFVINDKDNGRKAAGACRGSSYSFNRYIMRDGRWLNEAEMLNELSNSNENAAAIALVSVLKVTDRSYRYAVTHPSAIGSSVSKSNGYFGKWVVSEKQAKAFNDTNPQQPIRTRSAWGINGTIDDATQGPAQIDCAVGRSGEEVDYLLYNANTSGTEINTADSARLNCAIRFSVDFGSKGRAIVKVQLAGEVGTARRTVESARREIIDRFKEVSK